MLVVMAQDVADIMDSLSISPSPSVTIFRSLWMPFLVFIVLYFLLPPDVTTGKLDFSNVLRLLPPVLNPKCAECVAML